MQKLGGGGYQLDDEPNLYIGTDGNHQPSIKK